MLKNIRPEIIATQKRFFEALEKAIQDNAITGLQGFCKDYQLNRVKYQRIRTSLQNPDASQMYKIIDLDALLYICKDYNVSPEWLLLGRGEMYAKKCTSNEP
jgi:hypothetical protein